MTKEISFDEYVAIVDEIRIAAHELITKLMKQKLPAEYQKHPKTLLLIMSRLMPKILYIASNEFTLPLTTDSFCWHLKESVKHIKIKEE